MHNHIKIIVLYNVMKFCCRTLIFTWWNPGVPWHTIWETFACVRYPQHKGNDKLMTCKHLGYLQGNVSNYV